MYNDAVFHASIFRRSPAAAVHPSKYMGSYSSFHDAQSHAANSALQRVRGNLTVHSKHSHTHSPTNAWGFTSAFTNLAIHFSSISWSRFQTVLQRQLPDSWTSLQVPKPSQIPRPHQVSVFYSFFTSILESRISYLSLLNLIEQHVVLKYLCIPHL